MKIISIANQKGGVGKTTTATNLGAGLLNLGKKVLVIDLDAQAHCSYSLGIHVHELKATIYELLKKESKIKNVIYDRQGLKIIPSTLDLSAADLEFSNIEGREFLLKDILSNLETKFDYILLDCPPALSLMTLNAFTTSTDIYITLQTEFLALQGLSKLLETINLVKSRLNSKLQISGVLCTRYDSRKKLNNEIMEIISQRFGDVVFKTYIRDNISLAEAPSFGKTIFEYAPKSNGAMDYLNLSKEVIERK